MQNFHVGSRLLVAWDGGNRSYQSPGSAVQSMSVVSPELGVSTLERRVSGGLGLLDAV